MKTKVCQCGETTGTRSPVCPVEFWPKMSTQKYATVCRKYIHAHHDKLWKRKFPERHKGYNRKDHPTAGNLCICCEIHRVGNNPERSLLCHYCYTNDGYLTRDHDEVGVLEWGKHLTRKANEISQELVEKGIVPTKHWNKNMGVEALREMFPEYAGGEL